MQPRLSGLRTWCCPAGLGKLSVGESPGVRGQGAAEGVLSKHPTSQGPSCPVPTVSAGAGALWSLGSGGGHHQQERTLPWPHLWDSRPSHAGLSAAKAGPKPCHGYRAAGPCLGLSASLWKESSASHPKSHRRVQVMGNQKRHMSSIRC